MRGVKFAGVFLAVIAFLFFVPMQCRVSAAEQTGSQGTWKGKTYYYYYNAEGRKLTGRQKIDGHMYYFDKNGRQKTGWQKIGKKYYYFRICNGKKGYMSTSKTVNGVKLGKTGEAKQTKKTLKKLKVLVMAQQVAEKATKPSMKRSEKLKSCFNYLIKHYKYKGSPTFVKSTQWECDYAISMFSKKHGSCYEYGAAFAFLANAVGYDKAYAVSSGGHGWAEVNGYVYDPAWEQIDKKHSYFGRSYNDAINGLAPNYKKARNYVRKI